MAPKDTQLPKAVGTCRPSLLSRSLQHHVNAIPSMERQSSRLVKMETSGLTTKTSLHATPASGSGSLERIRTRPLSSYR